MASASAEAMVEYPADHVPHRPRTTLGQAAVQPRPDDVGCGEGLPGLQSYAGRLPVCFGYDPTAPRYTLLAKSSGVPSCASTTHPLGYRIVWHQRRTRPADHSMTAHSPGSGKRETSTDRCSRLRTGTAPRRYPWGSRGSAGRDACVMARSQDSASTPIERCAVGSRSVVKIDVTMPPRSPRCATRTASRRPAPTSPRHRRRLRLPARSARPAPVRPSIARRNQRRPSRTGPA